MTMPLSGQISMLDAKNELGYTPTQQITFADTAVRNLFERSSTNSVIGLFDGYGRSKGGYMLLTSPKNTRTTLTKPFRSAQKFLTIVCVGGGGGGGGGSRRCSYVNNANNWTAGGGGGGMGYVAYTYVQTLRDTDVVEYQIGKGGNGGSARDGSYSGGSNGTDGTQSFLWVNGQLVCMSGAGSGGLVGGVWNPKSPYTNSDLYVYYPGGYTTSGVGNNYDFYGLSYDLFQGAPIGQYGYVSGRPSYMWCGNNAGASNPETWGGGKGAPGYNFNTYLPAESTVVFLSSAKEGTLGSFGTGGLGSSDLTWQYPVRHSPRLPTTGTGYGGGGGGGGRDDEYYSSSAIENLTGAPGGDGAILLKWN